jgi:hypothetical protein
MSNEQRCWGCSPLRAFFYEQWVYLTGLLESGEDEPDDQEAVADAIEAVVTGTDPRMRGIGNYKKKLREGVRILLNHVDGYVQMLPPAVAVRQKAYGTDPLLNALFVNKDEMQKIFSRTREMKKFFAATAAADQAYLPLFVSRKEKTVFGSGMEGELYVRDVKQQVVSFTGHQLGNPAETEVDARRYLKRYLFENVVDLMRTALCCPLNGEKEGEEDGGGSAKARKDPHVYLQQLIDLLSKPEELIWFHETRLRISRVGVVLDEDSTQRIVFLVSYPRQEMLSADELMEEFNHLLR